MTSYLDPSGWFFQWDSSNGLILNNVRHNHYRCADDMRIAGMWVGSHDPADPTRPNDAVLRQIRIGSSDFRQTELVPPTDSRAQNFGSIQGFGGYPTAAGVGATYVSTNSALGPNTNSEFLTLFQRFIFTRYGMNPPHEPGAVLPAARIFPLLGFRFIPLGTSRLPVRYFRVDYRLHFNLDSLGSDRTRSEKPLSGKSGRIPNQAGIFRDGETPPPALKVRGDFLGNVSDLALPDLADIFAAAEKPLQYEILSRGSTRGKAEFNRLPATWDNFHQWPADYPGGLPSTPGAFHSLHMHWRWSTVTGIEGATKLLPAAGQQQFKGIGGAGGPLLDPRVPDQTVRFAITTNFNSNLETDVLSTAKFEDLFLKRPQRTSGPPAGTPEDVKNGSDLVFWMSIEAFRGAESDALQNPWEGTLFIHGCYFAHEPEPSLFTKPGLISAGGNTRGSILKPQPSQKWARLAI